MDFTNPAKVIAQPEQAAAEFKRLKKEKYRAIKRFTTTTAQLERAHAALRDVKHDYAWEEKHAQAIAEAREQDD